MSDDIVAPVRVHLTGSDIPLASEPAPSSRRRLVTFYRTVILDALNPWAPLVDLNPNRHAFQIAAGKADANLVTCDFVISDKQSDASNIAGKAQPAQMQGKFLPGLILSYTSPEYHGEQAVWIAAIGTTAASGAAFPIYIGVADHVYVD